MTFSRTIYFSFSLPRRASDPGSPSTPFSPLLTTMRQAKAPLRNLHRAAAVVQRSTTVPRRERDAPSRLGGGDKLPVKYAREHTPRTSSEADVSPPRGASKRRAMRLWKPLYEIYEIFQSHHFRLVYRPCCLGGEKKRPLKNRPLGCVILPRDTVAITYAIYTPFVLVPL